MRIYGIKSGKNNATKFIARSYMYNSTCNNKSTPPKKKQEEDLGFIQFAVCAVVFVFGLMVILS